LREHLAALEGIDAAALTPAARLDVEVARQAFATALEGFGFGFGDVSVGSYRNSPYSVAQNVGAYVDVPQFLLDTDHTIANAADAEAYLARVELYAGQLDGETGRLQAEAARGVIAPDVLLDKTLAGLRMARAGEIGSWGLVQSIARRTTKIPGDWTARAERLCRERVAPALERQIAEIERHRARATADAGAWKLPDGEAYYAWALRAGTTTTLRPEEVHARGQEELRDLQSRMDAIMKTLGLTQGTVGERMTALSNDARYRFPDNDEGRAQIIALLNRRLAWIKARMPEVFANPVRGFVEVTRMAPEVEAGAPGAYGGTGSMDGTQPGRFWINLRTTDLHRAYSLPTLAHHEAIPGHAWQGEYTYRLPLIRTLLQFNAFSEGWALYAEQLADELGAYADDPVARLGYLQSLAFRACRLVVDTGLHARRWTRQQAIEWFAATNGSPVEEVTSEIDRYCAWPGQACGYKLGHSEILRLRGVAQQRLGARYDLRAFNDAVIGGGNVPMTVLAGVVDRYIAGTA
jgi:uncharacterized protein (DUF885 family)